MAMELCEKHQQYYRKVCVKCRDMPTPESPISYLSMMSDASRSLLEKRPTEEKKK